MAKLGRPGMSDEQRQELWRLWASGKSLSEIGRAIGHPPGSIFTVVKQTGGYVPSPKKRGAGTLTLPEREEISRGLARGDSMRQIARTLGRAASTISRETTNRTNAVEMPEGTASGTAQRLRSLTMECS